MKSSYYNVFCPFGEGYILFNTLTRSLFFVDAEAKDILEKNDISSIDEEFLNMFTDSGIVIDDNTHEEDDVALVLNQSRFDASSLEFHIFTTYECNLSCPYCHTKEETHMNKKDAACVIEFIKKAASDENNHLNIELRGGEPLLNMPVTLFIAEELNQWCSDTGREFSLSIATNGTLLTEYIEELKKYNCKVLVTVDGPKEIHDQRRTYKNGNGTFDDIIKGLSQAAVHGLETILQIIIDETSEDVMHPLLEFLRDSNLNTRISFRPAFNTSPACRWYDYCIQDEREIRVQTHLAEKARTMNLDIEQPENHFFEVCRASKIFYVAIDPHLRLFKCTVLTPHKEYAVGTVSAKGEPAFNPLNIDFLSRDPLLFDECRACALVPVCRGGCPAQALEAEGTTHKKVCNKSRVYEMIKAYSMMKMDK